MNRTDCKVLRSAAILLAQWAEDLRASYVNQSTRTVDWEPGAKRVYDKHLAVVKRLRKVANAEQKQLEQDRAAREFQAAYDEGDVE